MSHRHRHRHGVRNPIRSVQSANNAGTPAGSQTITVAVGTLTAADYQIVPANGIYTITKAPLSVTALTSPKR